VLRSAHAWPLLACDRLTLPRPSRCHTSAHQAEILRQGETRFLITGDVYRRDSVDKTHYPVFHQMEGFRVFTPAEVSASGMPGARPWPLRPVPGVLSWRSCEAPGQHAKWLAQSGVGTTAGTAL
jgi:tRNA synthetases class II core domain (F)